MVGPPGFFRGTPGGPGGLDLVDQASFGFIPEEEKKVKCQGHDGWVVQSSGASGSNNGGSGGPSPALNNYPWNKASLRSQRKFLEFSPVDVKMMVNKCGCGSSWCPRCSKRGSRRRIRERLSVFYWDSTRHITLTIDRDQFASGLEAWKYVNEKKLIANMIWNLRRTAGVRIIDWLWVLEFHGSDGFPHWHVFLQVEEEGKAGMIGGDLLRKYWPWGRWVREQPIYSKKHWGSILGYWDKHGYFGKDKGAQGVLPEWAQDLVRRVRRYGSMVLGGVDRDKGVSVDCRLGFGREKRAYRVILEECGKRTRVQVDSWAFKTRLIIEVPYKTICDEFPDGTFFEGSGYLVLTDLGELGVVSEKIPEFLPIVRRIMDLEEGVEEYFVGGGE